MHFSVTILGNNSALPAHGRHPTSQVVTFHDRVYLVDCGEGTQMQMSEYKIRRSRIRHIFISHLHGDHWLGLPGLINSYGLQSRKEPLHIFAPGPLEELIRLQMDCVNTMLPFELNFLPLEPGSTGIILEEEDLCVTAFPTDHRIPCFGFKFQEVHKKRKLLPQKAQEYGIPASFYNALQKGEDYRNRKGEIIHNEWVTEKPVRAKNYVFCADTRYDERLLPYITGCDLIYHETTYLHDQLEKAKARYHSTSIQAATLAHKAGAKRLLIGHFSSKYEDLGPFLAECLPVFPATELAMEGTTYII
ncbi:MAG: ribonuclease Z [Chitinophagaceae bacterium]|nr:MAG: ribonuclease Z [Chitinophagaceae bacterium]